MRGGVRAKEVDRERGTASPECPLPRISRHKFGEVWRRGDGGSWTTFYTYNDPRVNTQVDLG